MNGTLENLRGLFRLEIIAETSWTLSSAEIYALRELFAEKDAQSAEIERLEKALDKIINYTPDSDWYWGEDGDERKVTEWEQSFEAVQNIARAARESGKRKVSDA